MFSGIIETTTQVLAAAVERDLLRIRVQKPPQFTDLHTGDSICVDGVCLTLEIITDDTMQFALGPETLAITGWTPTSVVNRVVNVERSLRASDRVHGHFVTGHVDNTGTIAGISRNGDSQTMQVEFPASLKKYIWRKGSIAINGVSLTLNETSDGSFTVGLIPETLARTNLGRLRLHDRVNLEIDNMARGIVHNIGAVP